MSKFIFICNDNLSGLEYELIELPPMAGLFDCDVISSKQHDVGCEENIFTDESEGYFALETMH